MIKYRHLVIPFFIFMLASCDSPVKTEENPVKVTVTNDSSRPMVTIKSDTAVAYMSLKKYLPESVPGFKTEGYPDVDDKFTGEPTGETNSQYTSGGPVSFIKHLYKKKDAEIAVEIIDYKASPAVYKDLFKMFNPTVKVDTELETKYPLENTTPGIITQVTISKEENKSVAHIFVCDRFLVNINTVNTGKNNMIQETIQRIKLEALVKDLCNTTK